MIVGTFNGANIVQAPTKGYSDLHLEANDAVSVSRSPWTQQAIVYPWMSQWWSGTITLPPMTRAVVAPWQAFLMELQGQANVFLMGNALEALPMGPIPLSSVLTLHGAGQSGGSISIAGFPTTQTLMLMPGDNLQIGYRLYKVLEPVVPNSSGIATVSIFPYLRDAPANGTAVAYTNCQGLFRLTSNKRSWSYSPHSAWGIDPLQIIEAL